MRILYDSKLSQFKTPFGTLTPKQVCTVHIHIPCACRTTAVALVLQAENGAELREKVMEGFEFMGAKLDPVKNVEGNRKESVISADDSKVKICVIPTDEEIVIARDTLCIVTGKPIE